MPRKRQTRTRQTQHTDDPGTKDVRQTVHGWPVKRARRGQLQESSGDSGDHSSEEQHKEMAVYSCPGCNPASLDNTGHGKWDKYWVGGSKRTWRPMEPPVHPDGESHKTGLRPKIIPVGFEQKSIECLEKVRAERKKMLGKSYDKDEEEEGKTEYKRQQLQDEEELETVNVDDYEHENVMKRTEPTEELNKDYDYGEEDAKQNKTASKVMRNDDDFDGGELEQQGISSAEHQTKATRLSSSGKGSRRCVEIPRRPNPMTANSDSLQGQNDVSKDVC